METRRTKRIFKSRPTREGAGVHLRRVFGNDEVPLFDPFLLFDDFRNTDPAHYLMGFPWHPHRGIETITYVLQGDVEHGDSLGNKGVITSGDVQWMTAGSGIIHQEMPQGDANGAMEGFQLWANLPAASKMMTPRYQDIKSSQVPEVVTVDGVRIKVICGTVAGKHGPVSEIIIEPEYLDITLPPHSEYVHQTPRGHTVFAYVIDGKGIFGSEGSSAADPFIHNGTAVLYEDGDQVAFESREETLRFLLISGRPIKEPVAWYGPIVMNTEEELELAFDEYQRGTFIKNR